MTAIAKYFVSLGFKEDRSETQNVDRFLAKIQKKFQVFSNTLGKNLKLNINKFDVSQKHLNEALFKAYRIADKEISFQISRFDVNEIRLKAAVENAARRASVRVPLNPAQQGHVPAAHLSERSNLGRGFFGLGIMGAPAFVAGAGLYGTYALNRKNQEVVAAELQTQAVVQANGGTLQQGKDSFAWLQSQGNRVGFDYVEASKDYNVLISNLVGAGGTIEQSQEIFKGFSEYGRVNKLSNARQSLVFNALSQIAGKNALQAEELTRQLGNSLPGAKAIFAEAWQQKTGGKLTGQEAMAALADAMQKGLVKADILLPASQIASRMAQPGLSEASKASQAEQNRLTNAINKAASIASKAGVESGFARLFKSFTVFLEEGAPMVEGLAKGFDHLTKYVSFAVMLPQSIRRAIDGRDSWVADMIGANNVATMRTFLEGTKEFATELGKTFETVKGGWVVLFQESLKGWGLIFENFGQQFSDVFLYSFKMLNASVAGDLPAAARYGEAMKASILGASKEDVKAIADGTKDYDSIHGGYYDLSNVEKAARVKQRKEIIPEAEGFWGTIYSGYHHLGTSLVYGSLRANEYLNRDSIYYGDPDSFDRSVDKIMRDRRRDFSGNFKSQNDLFLENFGGKFGAPSTSNVTIQSGAFVINTQATDAEGIVKELEPHVLNMFKTETQKQISQAMIFAPQKE